jgi:hypothetical protein
VRQKHIEDAIRDAIAELDPYAVRGLVKLTGFSEAKSPQSPVIAMLECEGQTTEVQW